MTRAAHRAEEQRAESAVAAAADDDQIGPVGGLDDRLRGLALDEPAVDIRPACGWLAPRPGPMHSRRRRG